MKTSLRRISSAGGLLLLSLAASTSADAVRISQTVLLPDGRPAVGARVTIRTVVSQTGTLKKELNVVTDATGAFSTDVDVDKTDNPLQMKGYVIVDAPGNALTFENVGEVQRRSSSHEGPLRLTSGGVLSGTVTTQNKRPVADAIVTLHWFSVGYTHWSLNDTGAGFATPGLIGKTASDGTWTMRPVAIEEQTFGNGKAFLHAELSATAKIGSGTWAGSTELVPQTVGAPSPDRPDPFRQIVLYPTVTVRGQVVNAETGKPVAAAKLKLEAYPGRVVGTIPTVTSNAAGRFEFDDVPAVFELFVTASHPHLSQGWTRVTPQTPRMVIDGTGPHTYDSILVSLHSCATVSGRIIENETGQPPSPADLQNAILRAGYNDSFNDGDIRVGGFGVTTSVRPDGTFSFQTAVGANDIHLGRALYLAENRPLSLDVPAEGLKGFVLKVRKEPYFYVRFAVPDATRLKETEVFMRREPTGEGSQVGGVPQGTWTWPAQNWGDKLEIRVTRGSYQTLHELLPWTEITASPTHWPLTIALK